MDINVYEMRSLSADELEQVSGGVLPAVGVAVALASHVGVGGVATGLTSHFLTAFGLGYAVYSAASAYGGGSRRGTRSKANSH